ncbi:MAG: hypothetical protein V4732_02160 [Pseudomonadota bacterium]
MPQHYLLLSRLGLYLALVSASLAHKSTALSEEQKLIQSSNAPAASISIQHCHSQPHTFFI